MKKKLMQEKKLLEELQSKRRLFLGDIEKVFELGDSEIIANSIIDHILVLSLHQARINFVYSLLNQYVFDKSIDLCNNMVNLNFVTEKAFEETESEYSNDLLHFEIVRPKIDSWASNKANIVESSPADEQRFQENYNQSTNPGTKAVSFLQVIQTATKKNNLPNVKSSQAIKNNSIGTINEVKDHSVSSIKTSVNYSNLPVNKSKSSSTSNDIFGLNNNDSSLTEKKIIKSLLSRTTTKNFIYNQNNKKNEDENLPQQFSIIENQYDLGPVDELELVKEKALRIYFKEKDLERERKRRLEKERSSQDSEDENKKKKLFEELNRNTVALDSEGMVINVKTNDLDNLYIMPQPNVKIKDKDKTTDSARESIKQKEASREERDSKLINKTNNRFRTKSVTGQGVKVNLNLQNPPTTNVQIISIQNTMLETGGEDRNYQFNPIEHYDIRPGVTLDFFGARKTGGKFPKIEVRMSNEEFIEKLNHVGPKTNYLAANYLEKVDNAKIPLERRRITAKNESYENNTMRMSKIILGNHDENSENKLTYLINENIINPVTSVYSPPTKKNLYEIKKKQRRDKVKSIRNFRFKDLKKIDDDEIKEAFNTPEKNFDITDMYEQKKSPRKIFMNIEKEVGYMKKYPRERIAKDILYMTGQVKMNSKDRTQKYKNEQKIINNKPKA